jgi:hypothetical protein
VTGLETDFEAAFGVVFEVALEAPFDKDFDASDPMTTGDAKGSLLWREEMANGLSTGISSALASLGWRDWRWFSSCKEPGTGRASVTAT